MARFKWDDDREFEVLEHKDLVRAEAGWLEKQFGKNLDQFTWSDSVFASVLVTLRRNGVMLTLADTDDWTIGWIEDRIIADPEDVGDGEEPDPTEAAPDPAPSRRPGRSGGRSSSTTSA